MAEDHEKRTLLNGITEGWGLGMAGARVGGVGWVPANLHAPDVSAQPVAIFRAAPRFTAGGAGLKLAA